MSTATPDLSRRSFLKIVSVGGASFALGCYSPALLLEDGSVGGASLVANAFVQVDPDGKVTITVSRSEMGQGVRTSMAMIVAEQMDADWEDVVVVQAPGDGAKYGSQSTWGSQSTLSQYERLSGMGAAARAMLIAAASQKWGVEPATCRTDKCRVFHDDSGRSVSYGDLTEAASKLPVPNGDIKLKSKSEFKIIGSPLLRVDNFDVVTGKATFTQDVQVKGAVYASIERCPAFGGTLKSFDDAEARKVDGVIDVVKVSTGVAVVAENTWAAFQGREALKIVWDLGPNAELDSAEIERRLRAQVKDHPEMPAGSTVVEATYDYPYLAHFTMEPQNAVADVRSDSCEVWAPSQAPDRLKSGLVRSLGLPENAVTVHVPLLGGGFGRRGNGDFANEAVEISKQIGRPVKLQWTRADDTKHDYYRPQSHHSLRGAVDASGKPVAWSHQFIKAGRGRGRGGRSRGAQIPYAIEGASMTRGTGASSVPTGAWRAVDNGLIGPTNECFIDELAVAAGKDPYEFRRDNMGDKRLLDILQLVAEKGRWGKPMAAGRGQGIACFSGYGCRVAHVVEVRIVKGNEYEKDTVEVDNVTIAIDPGLAINPKGIEAQLEGCFMDAIAATLFAKITIENGGVVESDPFDYLWPKMLDAPKIEIHMINDTAKPGGMGETGFPSAPAAIANAVFAATGKRVRKFPIVVDELV